MKIELSLKEICEIYQSLGFVKGSLNGIKLFIPQSSINQYEMDIANSNIILLLNFLDKKLGICDLD